MRRGCVGAEAVCETEWKFSCEPARREFVCAIVCTKSSTRGSTRSAARTAGCHDTPSPHPRSPPITNKSDGTKLPGQRSSELPGRGAGAARVCRGRGGLRRTSGNFRANRHETNSSTQSPARKVPLAAQRIPPPSPPGATTHPHRARVRPSLFQECRASEQLLSRSGLSLAPLDKHLSQFDRVVCTGPDRQQKR